MKYDSKRVLTVHELKKGDALHGGMIAGKCVRWEVREIFPYRALLKIGDSYAQVTGKELRELAFYPADNCPMCPLNHTVKPSAVPQFHTIPSEIVASDIESSFRFRAAQYRGVKKTR